MKEKTKLQAVIWDMDGVLVDSEPVHFAAWREVFGRFNLPLDEQSLRETFGMTSSQVIRTIVEDGLSEELVTRIIDEKENLFRARIRQSVRYLPGARDWLQAFQFAKVDQALASSGSIETIDVILNALEARPYFDVVISGRDLPSKPQPDIFLLVAHQLKVDPGSCLVIEDAIAGVGAAKAAGMTCLAVATTNPSEVLQAADLVCADLSEFSEQHLQSLFHLD